MSKRDSFIFYRSFFEATLPLNKEQKAELFDSICEFALNQNEVESEGIVKGMFGLIKPQLEANYRRYLNGMKGGKPKQKQTKSKPNANQTLTKTKPNANVNLNDNVNANDNLNVNGNDIKEQEVIFPFNSLEFLNMWEIWKSYKNQEHKFKYIGCFINNN